MQALGFFLAAERTDTLQGKSAHITGNKTNIIEHDTGLYRYKRCFLLETKHMNSLYVKVLAGQVTSSRVNVGSMPNMK